MSQGLIQIGIVAGTVPSADSDQFQVKYARLWPLDPDPLNYLASGSSGPPGSPGGPLLFDFQRGRIGADVYMRGFLQRTRLPRTPKDMQQVQELVRELPELTEGPPDQVQAGLRSLFEDIPDTEE